MLVVSAAFLFLGSYARADAVTVENLQFTVTDYSFLPGIQTVVPSDGYQFLTVSVLVKTAADAKEIVDLQQNFLAIDEKGRVFTPVLYNGSSSFTASLAPDEKNLRLLFEVPKTAAVYQLAVLNVKDRSIAGSISLGKSSGGLTSSEESPLAVLASQGYVLSVYGVTQNKAAFFDKAPAGMKYIFVDVSVTGTGTEKSAAQIATAINISGGSSQAVGVVPTRSTNMVELANVRLKGIAQTVRGYLCFLAPEGLTEVAGLTDGTAVLDAALPISGNLNALGFAQLDADGAYHQAGWKVTVHGIRLAEKGALNPPAGFRYAIISLTVSNQAMQNLTVSSELAFAMTDANGSELTQAWFAELTDTVDAVLLPSESVSGEIAFLLPDGVKAGVLRVHLNMLGEPLLIDASAYLSE